VCVYVGVCLCAYVCVCSKGRVQVSAQIFAWVTTIMFGEARESRHAAVFFENAFQQKIVCRSPV